MVRTATDTDSDALARHSENCLNTSPGDQPPEGRPLKRQVALFLDPDLIAFADAQARLNHESRGHYIRRLIRRELNAAQGPT